MFVLSPTCSTAVSLMLAPCTCLVFFFMLRRPPRSTRTDTLFPYPTLFRSGYLYDTASLRFAYSSLTTPQRVYDYDMASRARVLRKEQEVPSGHDPDDYVSRRILARGHDGEEVPVSLVYRKTTPLDGSAPLLLYGYGSYGMKIGRAHV